MDGIGVLTFADGSQYTGQFQNGKQSGRGRMTQANGDIYQGEWKNNLANGYGSLMNTQGGTSEGDWLDDRQHGFGKETWEFGKIKFQGQYVNGTKNGKGRYEWSDGSYYDGMFVNGSFSGQGTYYFADTERTYIGQFEDNLFDGKGQMTQKDRVYTGDFKQGNKCGQGTLVYANGNKYIGSWQDDVQHGIGIFYNQAEGTKKQGEWKLGKRIQWLSKPIKVNGENNKVLEKLV